WFTILLIEHLSFEEAVDADVIPHDCKPMFVEQLPQISFAEGGFERSIVAHGPSQHIFSRRPGQRLLPFKYKQPATYIQHRCQMTENLLLIFKVMQSVIANDRIELFVNRRDFDIVS